MNDKTDFLRVDASESIFDLERVTKDTMAAFSGTRNTNPKNENYDIRKLKE